MRTSYLLVAAATLLLTPALWVLVSLTASPLHPDPEHVPSVAGPEPPPKWASAAAKAKRAVRELVAAQNLAGLSVAAGVDGVVVWSEGFGYADLRTGTPVTPRHRFPIGTASVALTAAAAGLPREDAPAAVSASSEPLFTKHCTQTREAQRYSNNRWIAVSAEIESATGQPFLTFMRERVFEPLGMRDTGPSPDPDTGDDFPLFNLVRELIHDPRATLRHDTPKPGHNRVTSYYPRFKSDPRYGLHLMRPLDYSCYAGAGMFASTPSDLVRFGMAVQSGRLATPGQSGPVTGLDALGGEVALLVSLPGRRMTVAAVANVSHAGTQAVVDKVAEAFAER